MRITALNLIAYGHFENKTLQFGQAPGFHLVHGDNEAGKSTALRALSSVLFGYPHGVVDGFKYDPKDIALGVDLIGRSGQTLSFIRKRRGQKALVTTDGKALDQSEVTAFLGGVDQDVFERVFALDHTRLHEHAQALLAEGGALGLSLAEAGSGIAGLKGVLDRLAAGRSEIFLPGGSKPTLNRLLSQIAELRAKARRLTVSLNDYKKRDKEIEETNAIIADAKARASTVSKSIRQLERVQRNLPQKAQHAAIVERLGLLAQIPNLPDDATQKRIQAQSEQDSATADLDIATNALTELETKIKAVQVDKSFLGHANEIEALSEDRPVIENADRDLPKREAERTQHCVAAQDILSKAELVGSPERLGEVLPSAIKRKAIETEAKKSTLLAGQLDAANQALTNARSALDAAKEKANKAPHPIDTDELEHAWRAAEKLGSVTDQISKRRRALERKNKAFEDAIAALGIRPENLSALRSYSIPTQKTVDRYKSLFSENDKTTATIQSEHDRAKEEGEEFTRQIDELSARGAVLTAEDVKRRRSDRDETWAIIRTGYIEKSPSGQEKLKEYATKGNIADHFAKQIDDADRAADTIREHVQDATELSIALRNKSDRVTRLSVAVEKLEAIAHDKLTLSDEWTKLWGPLTAPIQNPEEMAEWLRRREALLKEGEECERLEDEIEELESASSAAVARLAETLKKLGADTSATGLDELRHEADIVLKRNTMAANEFQKANQAVETLEASYASAEKTVNALTSQIEAHAKKWQEALSAGGLRADLSVEAASVILGFMNELDGLKSSIEALGHRIATMKKDRAAFQRSVSELAGLLPAVPDEDAALTCRRLETALKEAQAADAERKTLQSQFDIRKREKEGAEEKLQRSKTALESLCKIAGCSQPDELALIEQNSAEKRRLTHERDGIETRLRETGDGHSLDELFAECDGIAVDEIPSRLSDLGDEQNTLEADLERNIARRAELNKDFEALFAQDQAADYAQNAAIVEAQAADAASSYVELVLLELLLRQAIDIYRDRNQGPILAKAKTLFSELTDGAYSGLRADVDDKGTPILIAEHPVRGSLDIAALSDGTVDPLYLALRLGAIQEYNSAREPLPFIADDLLLSLGNRRARATLKTLGKIASDGQVLFFTHHEHMIDLAREVLTKDVLREHSL